MSLINKLKQIIFKRLYKEPVKVFEHPIVTILNEGWGHNLSVEMKVPVDRAGEAIPWFTYPAIEYLNQMDLSEFTVLEWGLGNSTRYFANRCKKILSIENDPDWYNRIKPNLPGNAEAILHIDEAYFLLPLSLNKKFDLIIVDGIKRKECLEVAVEVLSDAGVIIFDNSDRDPDLCAILRLKGFLQIDFHGFGPINYYTWTTSIFYSKENRLLPKSDQPSIPIGGGF